MNKVNIKQIIKEELKAVLNEINFDDPVLQSPGSYKRAKYGDDHALSAIEHEADGLEKGANVMIKGHEMGRQLDNDAIGKVILNMANKIRGHVKRHREEMSMPGW